MARLAVDAICLGWALYTATWVHGAYQHYGFFAGLLALFMGMLATLFVGVWILVKIEQHFGERQ